MRSLLIAGTIALDTSTAGTWAFFGVCWATVSSFRANYSRATSAPSGKALRRLTQPFQLVTIYGLGELRPVALGGFKFVSKFIDQFTKWSEVFLLKAISDVIDSVQLYNQHAVIPSG